MFQEAPNLSLVRKLLTQSLLALWEEDSGPAIVRPATGRGLLGPAGAHRGPGGPFHSALSLLSILGPQQLLGALPAEHALGVPLLSIFLLAAPVFQPPFPSALNFYFLSSMPPTPATTGTSKCIQTGGLACLGSAVGFLLHLEHHPNSRSVLGRTLSNLPSGHYIFILLLKLLPTTGPLHVLFPPPECS